MPALFLYSLTDSILSFAADEFMARSTEELLLRSGDKRSHISVEGLDKAVLS